MPNWVTEGYTEYARRFSGSCQLQLLEVAQVKQGSAAVIREKEGQKLMQAIPKDNRVVALDKQGHAWDTATLASQLQSWKGGGRNVCLVIGGPEGLSNACLKRAEQIWSLSNLTFPHPLVRVIAAEQLYRAESLLRGHPYHRSASRN